MYGSDQSASLEPQGWRNLVGSTIERYAAAMGDEKRKF